VVPWIALASIKALCRPSIGRHIFDDSFRPYCGSTWFGARRQVVAGMVEIFSRPVVYDYFSRLHIPDELLVPSLLMHLGVCKGPMNHFIQAFDQAHTGEIHEEHIDQLRSSSAFFARKFPDDPTATVRLRVLRELADSDAATELFRFDGRPHADQADLTATRKGQGASLPEPLFSRTSLSPK
jgi:hypothetical protein